MQEMHAGNEEEVELCSICNENPVAPGKDVCLMCLREMAENSGLASSTDDTDDPDASDALSSVSSVSNMDEMLQVEDDGTARGDFEEGDALSLERVREDEEREEEDEDMDE